jgi:hypothetical protein
MRLLCVATSSPNSPHFPFPSQPKSSRPHWLEFLMSFDLDICQRSKRGLFGLSCYLRNLSLTHSSPFFRVLLCYQFLLSLSLSLSSCFGSLVLEELGATLLLQPLPLIIKNCFGGIGSIGLCLHVPSICEVILLFSLNIIVIIE